MTHNGIGEKLAIGKNGDQVTEGRRGVRDSSEARGILRPQPLQVMQSLIGIGNRSEQYLNPREYRFRHGARKASHPRAGASGIAKVNLFGETRHETSEPERESCRRGLRLIIAFGTEIWSRIETGSRQFGFKRDLVTLADDAALQHCRVESAHRP